MALSKQDPRLAFYCEKYDDISHLTRRFVLLFYYEDHSIEMRELPKNVLHLKRTPFPNMKIDDFNIGAVLTLFGVVVKLTEYADEVTRGLCGGKGESTVVLLGESLIPQVGRSLAILTEECGFTISAMQMTWAVDGAEATYGLPAELVGGRVLVVRCAHTDAIQKGMAYVNRVPEAHAARDGDESKRWLELLDDATRQPVAIFNDISSSVVIVKPHALKKQAGGSIIQQLMDLTGLELTALMLTNLSSRVVDRFLEPYKGVLPDFVETASALVGPVWILQVVSLNDDVNVVSTVREACGPFDPLIARELRPTTIRAMFGVNRAENAVHCCDLPEEGPLYTDFFFRSKNIQGN